MKTSITSNALKSLFAAALILPFSAHADSGLYIGASAGGATIEADFDGVTIPGLPSSIDEDDTATKFFAGYTLDLPALDLAVEGGYVNFGEPDVDVLGDELTLELTGFNVWGVATLNAGLIDVYGKVGMLAWEAEATLLGVSDKTDGTDIGYGIGAAFGLGPVEVRGEYELYELDDTDVSMLSLGVIYRF